MGFIEQLRDFSAHKSSVDVGYDIGLAIFAGIVTGLIVDFVIRHRERARQSKLRFRGLGAPKLRHSGGALFGGEIWRILSGLLSPRSSLGRARRVKRLSAAASPRSEVDPPLGRSRLRRETEQTANARRGMERESERLIWARAL